MFLSHQAQLGYYCCSYSQVFRWRDGVLRIYLFITRNLTNTELISCQQSAGDNALPLLLIDFSLHIIINNTKKLQRRIAAPGRCLFSVICSYFDLKYQGQRGWKWFVLGLSTCRKKLDNHWSEELLRLFAASCLVIILRFSVVIVARAVGWRSAIKVPPLPFQRCLGPSAGLTCSEASFGGSAIVTDQLIGFICPYRNTNTLTGRFNRQTSLVLRKGLVHLQHNIALNDMCTIMFYKDFIRIAWIILMTCERRWQD